jgi:hypothetical protein
MRLVYFINYICMKTPNVSGANALEGGVGEGLTVAAEGVDFGVDSVTGVAGERGDAVVIDVGVKQEKKVEAVLGGEVSLQLGEMTEGDVSRVAHLNPKLDVLCPDGFIRRLYTWGSNGGADGYYVEYIIFAPGGGRGRWGEPGSIPFEPGSIPFEPGSIPLELEASPSSSAFSVSLAEWNRITAGGTVAKSIEGFDVHCRIEANRQLKLAALSEGRTIVLEVEGHSCLYSGVLLRSIFGTEEIDRILGSLVDVKRVGDRSNLVSGKSTHLGPNYFILERGRTQDGRYEVTYATGASSPMAKNPKSIPGIVKIVDIRTGEEIKNPSRSKTTSK